MPRYIDATIICPLFEKPPRNAEIHGYLVQLDDGTRARLPCEELKTLRKGAKDRVIAKGLAVQVIVIHKNQHNGNKVVSERAAVFHRGLDRMTAKNGWTEHMPEEHYWYYTKGRWSCKAIWATWHLKFQARSRPAKPQT